MDRRPLDISEATLIPSSNKTILQAFIVITAITSNVFGRANPQTHIPNALATAVVFAIMEAPDSNRLNLSLKARRTEQTPKDQSSPCEPSNP